jgi:hypothetical protein
MNVLLGANRVDIAMSESGLLAPELRPSRAVQQTDEKCHQRALGSGRSPPELC